MEEARWLRDISATSSDLESFDGCSHSYQCFLRLWQRPFTSPSNTPLCASSPTLPYTVHGKISYEPLHVRSFPERLLLRKASIPRNPQ